MKKHLFKKVLNLVRTAESAAPKSLFCLPPAPQLSMTKALPGRVWLQDGAPSPSAPPGPGGGLHSMPLWGASLQHFSSALCYRGHFKVSREELRSILKSRALWSTPQRKSLHWNWNVGKFKPKDTLENRGGFGGKRLEEAGSFRTAMSSAAGQIVYQTEPAVKLSKRSPPGLEQTWHRTQRPTLPKLNWNRLWNNWCPRVLYKADQATGEPNKICNTRWRQEA